MHRIKIPKCVDVIGGIYPHSGQIDKCLFVATSPRHDILRLRCLAILHTPSVRDQALS
jgi:hypothetical protein